MNLPVAGLYVLALLWTAVAAVAVALVAVGARGRQVDRLGRCRACGYVITGSRGSSTCPECGADLARTGLRFGHRRVLMTPLVFGLMLLAVALTPIAVLMARQPQAVTAAVTKNAGQRAAGGSTISGVASVVEMPGDVVIARNELPDTDVALWGAGARGLLDEAGRGHGPPILLPGDVLAGVPINPGPQRVDGDGMRAESTHDGAGTTRDGDPGWSFRSEMDGQWTGGGLIFAWEMQDSAAERSGSVGAPFSALALPTTRLRSDLPGFAPMSWRIEPVQSAGATAWTSTPADAGTQVQRRAESTAVKPERVDSGRR